MLLISMSHQLINVSDIAHDDQKLVPKSLGIGEQRLSNFPHHLKIGPESYGDRDERYHSPSPTSTSQGSIPQ